MDEVGDRIEANTAGPEAEGGVAQVGQLDAFDADVGGLAQHVLAVARHLAALGVELGVGLRRPVAGDQLERLIGADLLLDAVQHVEQPRVHDVLLAIAPVAHHPHGLGQGVGDVLAVLPVDRVQHLAGVQVMQVGAAIVAERQGRALQRLDGRRDCGGGGCARRLGRAPGVEHGELRKPGAGGHACSRRGAGAHRQETSSRKIHPTNSE